jgi:hypothetical protein
MDTQTAPVLAASLAASRPGSMIRACRWRDTGGTARPSPGPRPWTVGWWRAIRAATGEGEPVSQPAKSANTRWNGSPAARDSG